MTVRTGLARFLQDNGLTLVDHHGWAIDAKLAARAFAIREACGASDAEAPVFNITSEKGPLTKAEDLMPAFEAELDRHRVRRGVPVDFMEGPFLFETNDRGSTLSWSHPASIPDRGSKPIPPKRRAGLPSTIATWRHGRATIDMCGAQPRTRTWIRHAETLVVAAAEMDTPITLIITMRRMAPLTIIFVEEECDDPWESGKTAWIGEAVQVIETNLQSAGAPNRTTVIQFRHERSSSATLEAIARKSLASRKRAFAKAMMAGGAPEDGHLAKMASL